VHRALDLGVNYLDTAPSYSDSEEVLGHALEGVSHHFYLATKLGGRPQPFDPKDKGALRRSVEESLHLLRRDHIDVLLIHEPDRPQAHRWWSRLAQGEGLVDYALLSSDLEGDARLLRERDLAVQGPADGGRQRPDGQRIAWRSMMLGRGVGHPALPFVIQDVTPRELRVPGGAATRHQLPVQRVAGLTLVVADLLASENTFEALVGTEGAPATPGVEGAVEARVFAVGPHWLELVQPADPHSALGRSLQARGEGPYEVVLSGEAPARPGSGDLLPLEATHGARLRVAR